MRLKALTLDGRDALGRLWTFDGEDLVPYHGIFHHVLDSKDRWQVYKLNCGQYVEISDEEADQYVQRMLRIMRPPRFITLEEQAARTNRMGFQPRDLDLVPGINSRK